MTPQQSLLAALEGEVPETTPLTIYDWNMGAVTTEELAEKMRQPAWRQLLERGLTVRCHCPVVKAVEHGVEYRVMEEEVAGVLQRQEIKTTPVGQIEKVTRNGWHHEDWIKSPADYKTQEWIIEHTELTTDYDAFARAEQVVGDHGIVVVTGSGNWQHRSPAMCINVDLAGTERFCMDLATDLPELRSLYTALRRQFLEEQHLIAAGPGRYVAWFENLTIGMLGPQRYHELLVPVYEEAVPIHTSGNKRVMVHYDGHLKVVADQIAAAPYAIIDSLTEPPEGDITYDQCRRYWPDLVFWANINMGLYCRPAEELREAVIAKRERAGKKGLAFEISEDLPTTWQETIPVVLDTLHELD
jgi:hypothetical protein